MKKILSILIISGIVILTGCTQDDEQEDTDNDTEMQTEVEDADTDEDTTSDTMEGTPITDEQMKDLDETDKNEIEEMSFDYTGTLSGVQGFTGAGTAMATFTEGQYTMKAEIENIPDPEGTNFYEGWIVRPSPFEFISTGVLEKVDGKWVNTYMSEQDLTDHPNYVLTIEPDDGDPAPAGHVVEGTMVKE